MKLSISCGLHFVIDKVSCNAKNMTPEVKSYEKSSDYRIKLSISFQVHMLPCFDEHDSTMIQDEVYFRSNRPDFDPFQSCQQGTKRNEALIEWIRQYKNPNRKTFLIKHHLYLNFTSFDTVQPTYINVARKTSHKL